MLSRGLFYVILINIPSLSRCAALFSASNKNERMSQIADEDVYMHAYYRLCYYYLQRGNIAKYMHHQLQSDRL